MPVWLTVMNSWVTFLKPLKIISKPWLLLKKSETTSNFDFYKIGFDRSKRKVYEGLIRVLVKIKDSKRDSKVDEQLFNTINQLQARVFLEEMDNLKKGRTSSTSSRELAELEGAINDF